MVAFRLQFYEVGAALLKVCYECYGWIPWFSSGVQRPGVRTPAASWGDSEGPTLRALLWLWAGSAPLFPGGGGMFSSQPCYFKKVTDALR